jgi:hypothetical protein
MQLTADGRRLLEYLSFLGPEPVPTTLLDVPVPVGAETPNAEDPGQHAALADLTTNSLATLDPGSETFVIHRLVQDVTRRGLAQAGTAHQRLTETLASPAKKISLHHDVGHVLRPLTMFGHQAAPHGMSVPNPVGRRHFLLVTIRNSLLHNAVRQ